MVELKCEYQNKLEGFKMKDYLKNLKLLKKDMINNNWIISAFNFKYKNIDYIVLVKLYLSEKPQSEKYDLLKLDFLRANNLNAHLLVPANSFGLHIDVQTLRTFFGIEYSENLGNILQQFNKLLGACIPVAYVKPVGPQLTAVIQSLNNSDSQDPNKIYCYKVHRNSLNRKRSVFNSEKTRLIRPNLFQKLGEDITLSFDYSPLKSKEKSDEEILMNWSNNI